MEDPVKRLASIEPWDLCAEAKVEKCRATRDLRSCGRMVQHLLVSCGHACLCAECSQRCDLCPICRVAIPRHGSVIRIRLYDQFVEAGLLPSTQEEESRERDKEGNQWSLDVMRLHSLFDVTLENNLISLICHYVTDVCMDEGAVSSDAVISMLLDGSVVKDWCKKKFLSLVQSLREIYNLSPKQMCSKLDSFPVFATKLKHLIYVLETLEAPLNPLSPALLEIQQLLEGIRRVSQHLELMTWCIRHRFLENVECRHASISHWRTTFKERKIAANERAWSDYVICTGKPGPKPQSSLFIEDAIFNLGLGNEDEEEVGNESALLRHENLSSPSSLRARREASMVVAKEPTNIYPPESIRAAVDFLFLEVDSELLVAKRSIFLYYLFDRHWSLPGEKWMALIDDYTTTFSIPRHSVLESFTFYLLDDNNLQALEEACNLLPEIVTSSIHPKIARVLLERKRPDTAASVLRSSGRNSALVIPNTGLSDTVVRPVSEAVTAVRVLLECGLLTEAYHYQRVHCQQLKADEQRYPAKKSNYQEGDPLCRSYSHELDLLVGEICWLCIRRNLVEKMLELPWQADEEKTICNCLFERAIQDPSCAAGSLLVVFYMQRCRYMEAYMEHRRLITLENQYLSQSTDKEKAFLLREAREQRSRIIENCLDLLPEIQRQLVVKENRSHSLSIVTNKNDNSSLSGHTLAQKEDSEAQNATNTLLVSPLLSANLPESVKKQAATILSRRESTAIKPHSQWGGFKQPSILHGLPFRSLGAN